MSQAKQTYALMIKFYMLWTKTCQTNYEEQDLKRYRFILDEVPGQHIVFQRTGQRKLIIQYLHFYVGSINLYKFIFSSAHNTGYLKQNLTTKTVAATAKIFDDRHQVNACESQSPRCPIFCIGHINVTSPQIARLDNTRQNIGSHPQEK